MGDKDTEKSSAISKAAETRNKPHSEEPFTFFVAVQIKNQELYSNFEVVQKHVKKQNYKLAQACVPVSLAHITLFLLRLNTDAQVARAVEALKSCSHFLQENYSKDPLTLEFQGLGHFNHRVLYADMGPTQMITRLTELKDYIFNVFEKAGLDPDLGGKFRPHVTLMKLSNLPVHRRKEVRKIEPEYYQGFAETLFGSHTLGSVQLCVMGLDGESYYEIEHEEYFEQDTAADA